MNTTSASPSKSILVWDAPVRVFHWMLVLCFAGAYWTAQSERWRLLHVTLGYTMAGLVAFRLVWGLVGTQHARFTAFVRGPTAVMGYVRSLLRHEPEHHVGHNPAGALAIVLLLALAIGVGVSGYAVYNDWGGNGFEKAHELTAYAMLAVVVVHVAGVVVSSRMHHENLVRAMLTGRKPGPPEEGIARTWPAVALLMALAVLAFWWWQWQSVPPAV